MNHENPDNIPNWAKKLIRLIDKHWHHHGPCQSINFKTFKGDGAWMIYASPAYQEVYGGDHDGQQVWTGFIFEAGDFSKESGLWIEHFAVVSHCAACNSYPKMMFKGKFRGHNVFVNIMLEPDKESTAVEILDTIKQEIRQKE